MQTKADRLLESTIGTLDGGSDSVKPRDGASLIDAWITALQQEHVMSEMAKQLQELREELSCPTPDSRKISSLLKKLSDHTARAARRAKNTHQELLVDLADSLLEFSKELK